MQDGDQLIRDTMKQVMRENPGMSADEVRRMTFNRLGGGLIETALTCSLVMNAHAIASLLQLRDRLRASHTEEGRERYCYDNDYTKDGQVRAILNATESRVREQERRIGQLVDTSGKKEGVENFDVLIADCMDAFDECIKPVTSAMTRYFIVKQVEDRKTEDCFMRADVLTASCICHVNQELYAYLVQQVPAIGCFREYAVLSGWTMLLQLEKIEERLVGDYGWACKNDKRCIEMLKDLSRLVFSTEVLGKVCRARGVDTPIPECKSVVEGFEESTMSLNYYRLHYDMMYRHQDIVDLMLHNRKIKSRKHHNYL